MNWIEMKKMLFLDLQDQVLKYFTASSNKMLIEVQGNFCPRKSLNELKLSKDHKIL